MIELTGVKTPPPPHVLTCAVAIAAEMETGNTHRITQYSESGKQLAALSRDEAHLALKIALQGNDIKISSSALEIASSLKTEPIIGAVSDLLAEQLQDRVIDEITARWLKLCHAWVTTWQQVGVCRMPWRAKT